MIMWWFLLLLFSVHMTTGNDTNKTVACFSHFTSQLTDYEGCTHILWDDKFFKFSLAMDLFTEEHKKHIKLISKRDPWVKILLVAERIVSPRNAVSVLKNNNLDGAVLLLRGRHHNIEEIKELRKVFEETNLLLMVTVEKTDLENYKEISPSFISTILNSFDFVFTWSHRDDYLKSFASLSENQNIENYLIEQGIDREKILLPLSFIGWKRERDGTVQQLTREEICEVKEDWTPYYDKETKINILAKDGEEIYFHGLQSIKYMAQYITCLNLGGVVINGLENWDWKESCGPLKQHLMSTTLLELHKTNTNIGMCQELISHNFSRKEYISNSVTEDNSCSLIIFILTTAVFIVTFSFLVSICIFCYLLSKRNSTSTDALESTLEMQRTHAKEVAYGRLIHPPEEIEGPL